MKSEDLHISFGNELGKNMNDDGTFCLCEAFMLLLKGTKQTMFGPNPDNLAAVKVKQRMTFIKHDSFQPQWLDHSLVDRAVNDGGRQDKTACLFD